MASRHAGRRTVAEQYGKGGRRSPVRQQPGKRESRKDLYPKERRQLIQLVICGSALVVLVAVKLLLPETLAAFNEQLNAAMERNMDVQAVFSAVGRAFSGEEDAAEDVYQAVFHPEDPQPLQTAALLPEGTSAMDTLRQYRQGTGDEAIPQTETAEQAETVSPLSYVLYSDETLPEGVSLEQAMLGFDYCVPVNGVISSDFGYRDHPTEGEERFHYGVDLAAESGTEVCSFADGTVTAVGESSTYGKYCMVAHESGFTTLYAHCSRITVSSGTAVTRGQQIAAVGETGMATGPHLHFELHRNGTYLNPVYYLTTL